MIMSTRRMFQLIIIFYSRFGAIKALAEQVAEGGTSGQGGGCRVPGG
jgi:hypothetical protein